ncbi:hypothetical protein HBB16_01895 [Pseudonocardia sp. MCCB 268]|nr:hypothetical protein [Pseudonocardia cytotoxica]
MKSNDGSDTRGRWRHSPQARGVRTSTTTRRNHLDPDRQLRTTVNFRTLGWKIDGREAVTELYRRMLPGGLKQAMWAEKRVHAVGPEHPGPRGVRHVQLPDGRRHRPVHGRHRVRRPGRQAHHRGSGFMIPAQSPWRASSVPTSATSWCLEDRAGRDRPGARDESRRCRGSSVQPEALRSWNSGPEPGKWRGSIRVKVSDQPGRHRDPCGSAAR